MKQSSANLRKIEESHWKWRFTVGITDELGNGRLLQEMHVTWQSLVGAGLL